MRISDRQKRTSFPRAKELFIEYSTLKITFLIPYLVTATYHQASYGFQPTLISPVDPIFAGLRDMHLSYPLKHPLPEIGIKCRHLRITRWYRFEAQQPETGIR